MGNGSFKVYDPDGNNVTDERKWFLGTDGTLYCWDNFLEDLMAAECYWYSFD